MPLKASYHTLGCKLNFSETATIASLLKQKGIEEAGSDIPDVCVVNTCSVTGNADKKGRQLIRKLANRYPHSSIFVTGCYAQLKPEEVASLPNVALVLGSNEKLKISQYVDAWLESNQQIVDVTPGLSISEFIPSCERGNRTRYFLKVQDGCDYFCTYCTIPFARGKSRSGTVAQMVEMAREVAMKGGKEIVLTGVNIGTFGKESEDDFLSLVKALDKVKGIERFRISSIEPNLLSDDIIEFIAKDSRAFMPHFHIPLQSGSDKVLKLMNRRYDTRLFQEKIDRIRRLIPDAFIGVDIIAGARGETRLEWENSLKFARDLDVQKFHAFPYSEREGTKAIGLGEAVPQQERYDRVAVLNELSEIKTRRFIKNNLGKDFEVLWENVASSGKMQGLTPNYIRVEAPKIPELINDISAVKLLSIKGNGNEVAEANHIF